MLVRLQKFLADAGVASRRKSEELILKGLVTVNEKVIAELGFKIDDDSDVVKYNGQIIKNNSALVYFMLNKPRGYVTTVKDQFGRPDVMCLIKEKERLFPVGRLDYDTSGLLIMTNDGDLTYKLTHPKHTIIKSYRALVKGIPSENEMERLKSGVDIGGFITSKAQAKILDKKNEKALLEIGIYEGKNRQVRRMCEAIGHPILSLKRISVGKLRLDGLAEGTYRSLTAKEIEYLKSL